MKQTALTNKGLTELFIHAMQTFDPKLRSKYMLEDHIDSYVDMYDHTAYVTLEEGENAPEDIKKAYTAVNSVIG